MEESNASLRLELRQLSTNRRSLVRRAMFPELYSFPTDRFRLALISTFYSRHTKLISVIASGVVG